jgi:serine/threonine protein kinase
MWRKKIFDGTELGLSKPFTFTDLAAVHLPRLTLDNKVVTDRGIIRAQLRPTSRVGKGGHSILTEYTRHTDSEQRLILLKRSNIEEISFRTEAFIQWLAQKVLAPLGKRIPPVLDILNLPDDTVGFTMTEFTNAQLCSRWLVNSSTPNTDILHILAQSAILLQVLEDTLALDHRDLKADNLLILPEPSSVTYVCTSGGCAKKYCITSPFTVAIVDFGFACLGSDLSLTEVDAGEGTLPPLDPCPKDGRDLFHLIVSLYGIEAIRSRLSSGLRETFLKWMEVAGKPCGGLAERWSHSEWIYLLTSRKEFAHPACTPRAILETIAHLEPDMFVLVKQ